MFYVLIMKFSRGERGGSAGGWLSARPSGGYHAFMPPVNAFMQAVNPLSTRPCRLSASLCRLSRVHAAGQRVHAGCQHVHAGHHQPRSMKAVNASCRLPVRVLSQLPYMSWSAPARQQWSSNYSCDNAKHPNSALSYMFVNTFR